VQRTYLAKPGTNIYGSGRKILLELALLEL
jgi:hypothetical protein